MRKRRNVLGSAGFPVFIVLFLVISIPACNAQSMGDVNSNNAVDIVDALVIAQYYVGLNPSNFNAAVADTNCSGTIDIVDALVIAQYYVGLIAQLPCTLQTATPAATPVPAQPTATPGNITVWLAGDSTMANGGSACPIGYGGQLQQFFKSNVTVANYARSGRSVNTWLYNVLSTSNSNGDCDITRDSNGNPTVTADWQAMLDGMKAGDYLIVSFGINDGTSACPRHASQATFMADLGIMAQAAKARGANPVFMTPVSAISCKRVLSLAERRCRRHRGYGRSSRRLFLRRSHAFRYDRRQSHSAAHSKRDPQPEPGTGRIFKVIEAFLYSPLLTIEFISRGLHVYASAAFSGNICMKYMHSKYHGTERALFLCISICTSNMHRSIIDRKTGISNDLTSKI